MSNNTPLRYYATHENAVLIKEKLSTQCMGGEIFEHIFDRVCRTHNVPQALTLRPSVKNKILYRYCSNITKNGKPRFDFGQLVISSIRKHRSKKKQKNIKLSREKKQRRLPYDPKRIILPEGLRNDEHFYVIVGLPAEKFYNTTEWKSLRYQALRKMGNTCMVCGASATDGNHIAVDHIKPRSLYPELALSLSNLQILCQECNEGKGTLFSDDWRVK